MIAYGRKLTDSRHVTKAEPIGDWASHPADAFRTMAEAHRSGLFTFKHINAAPDSPLSPAD